MEVKFIETTKIKPIQPPFKQDHLLPFSHLDNDPNLNVTIRTLRVYAAPIHPSTSDTNSDPDPDPNPFQVISQSLSKALLHYFPAAAILLRRPSDHRLQLSCTADQGVPIVRASANFSLASVDYFNDINSPFLDLLVPDPIARADELVSPLMVQITVFTCGGFSLGVCFHHSMCDGIGSTQFLNAVAELARGAEKPTVEAVWHREVLLRPRDPPRVKVEVLRECLRLDKGFHVYNYDEVNYGRVVKECFHVSDDCVEQFKVVLAKASGLSFTTFEALGAFIWRARVKASCTPGEETVQFTYSTNIRKKVKPPLPNGYWGNGCVPIYVKMTAKELVERPVWETAELIKKSKQNITDEYVKSYIDFQELYYSEGMTAGKGVNGFTDWRHLGHSMVDFGWGGPVNVLPLSYRLLGSVEPCFFLPHSCVGEGKKNGFKALVCLRENAVPAFRLDMEEFQQLHSTV